MIFLAAFIVVHILCWGAIGAALSPRAGFPTYVGALLSILLPLLGSLILAGMAVWGGRGRAAPETDSAWRLAAWVGVSGGVLVAVSGFLPWLEAELNGNAGGAEEGLASISAGDYVALPVTLVVVGLLMAGFTWLAARRGNREWLVGTAYFAWFPAALGATLVVTEDFIDTWVARTNSATSVLVETDVVDAGVTANFDIGAGPYAVMMGGLIALIWSFVWSLRRPTSQLAAAKVGLGASSGATLGTGAGAVGTGALGGYGLTSAGSLTASDDWAEPSAGGGWDAASWDGSSTQSTSDDWSQGHTANEGEGESEKWW